jgi:hypothetical protein
VFNAAQLATAPALAVSGNSPLLLGHQLWEETRVALFKQSVDERRVEERAQHRAPRVSFGQGWVQQGAYELFEEAVRGFDPVLPLVSEEQPLGVPGGQVPSLSELRLHNGTVWRWNRPVYDPTGGGHVRMELRSLPAGPTVQDMVANAAFLIGATLALASTTEKAEPLPFDLAESNFYRAAQLGPDATLMWPGLRGPEPRRASDVALELIEPARGALAAAGVPPTDSDDALEVFRARAQSGETGARWQRRRLVSLGRQLPRSEALRQMCGAYAQNSERGDPVHTWPA